MSCQVLRRTPVLTTYSLFVSPVRPYPSPTPFCLYPLPLPMTRLCHYLRLWVLYPYLLSFPLTLPFTPCSLLCPLPLSLSPTPVHTLSSVSRSVSGPS